MAIKKEALKALLKSVKAGTEEEINALVDSSDEKDFSLPEGTKVYSPEEYTTLEKNLKDAGKGAYTKAGKEIAIKELKEKIGLEYDGKDFDTFIEKAKEFFVSDAKLPADEAKKQWEIDKKKLQDQVTEMKGKYDTEVNTRKSIERDATLLKKFPASRNTSLNDEDRLLLLKNKIEVKEEDGKEVVYYKGQKLQDNLTNPLAIDAALSEVFKSEKWIDAEGGAGGSGGGAQGRGGKDGKVSTTFTKASEVVDYYAKQGKSATGAHSQEIVDKMAECAKANPEFDFNN